VKDCGFAIGVERDWSDFRFLSGRKWVARLSFYNSFTPAFYRLITATYCSDVARWWTRDRRDFCFRSRYFRFRPGGKFCAFRVNIGADSYLGPSLPGSRAEYHPCRFGLGYHFRSGYFRYSALWPMADRHVSIGDQPATSFQCKGAMSQVSKLSETLPTTIPHCRRQKIILGWA